MAVLYITEMREPSPDSGGRMAQIGEMAPVAEQTVAIAGSSASSSAFNASTSLVRLNTDVACSIAFGTAPTATATKARMSAGATEYFRVRPGDKVAVISNT